MVSVVGQFLLVILNEGFYCCKALLVTFYVFVCLFVCLCVSFLLVKAYL